MITNHNLAEMKKWFIELVGFDSHGKYHLMRVTADKIDSEDWRSYHSWDNHIYPMIEKLYENRFNYNTGCWEAYFWATLFHDVVYDPFNKIPGGNEAKSIDYWCESAKGINIDEVVIKDVINLISATYGHESEEPTIRDFLKMDLDGFNCSFQTQLDSELKIRKEFNHVDWDSYKEGRIKFLTAYAENTIIKEMGVQDKLLMEVEHVKQLTPKIAIYPGSFNPFHVGHLNILEKAEKIFDKVVLVYAKNPNKQIDRNVIIPSILKHRQVEVIEGSLPNWMETLPYPVTLIRGLRNSSDLQYEQNYLFWLNELSVRPINCVSVFCDKDYENISSTNINALLKVDEQAALKYICK